MLNKENVPLGICWITYGETGFVTINPKNKFLKAHELLGRMYCCE
jgi:hypothetical protein